MMLDHSPNLRRPPDPAAASLSRPRPLHRHQRSKNVRKKPPQRGLGVAQLEKLRLEEESKQGGECLASLHHLQHLMRSSLCPSQQISLNIENSYAFFDNNGTSPLPTFSFFGGRQPLSLPNLHLVQGFRDNQAQDTSLLRSSILPYYRSAAMVPGLNNTWARVNDPYSSVFKDGRHSTIAFDSLRSFETSSACNAPIGSCHAGELSSFQSMSLCPSLAWSASRDQPCSRKRPRVLTQGHETTLESFQLVDLNALVDDESKDQDDSATGCCIAGARSGSWGSLLKVSPSNPADLLGLNRPQRYGCMKSRGVATFLSTRLDSDYLTIGTPFLTRSSGKADNTDAACIGNGPAVDEFLTLAPSWCLTQNYGCSAASRNRIETADILDDSATSCHPRGKGPTVDGDHNFMSCMQNTQTGCSYAPHFEFLWNEDEDHADHHALDDMLANATNAMVDLELRLSL